MNAHHNGKPYSYDVSVIVPVKDEEENILSLADEIDQTLKQTDWSYEVVWINDGSTDKTPEILDHLSEDDRSNHQPIHMPYNVGQSAAMWTGFRFSHGKIIVTLDGDGQNDPRDIPKLVKQVLSGETDVANGFREQRRDNFQRRIASRIANGFRNWMIGNTVRDVGCSIRAMRRECVEHLPLFHGMHRFLPALFVQQGFRIDEQPVNHRPRQRGQTKYTINKRLWVGLYDIFGMIWLRHRGLYHKLPQIDVQRKIVNNIPDNDK